MPLAFDTLYGKVKPQQTLSDSYYTGWYRKGIEPTTKQLMLNAQIGPFQGRPGSYISTKEKVLLLQ